MVLRCNIILNLNVNIVPLYLGNYNIIWVLFFNYRLLQDGVEMRTIEDIENMTQHCVGNHRLSHIEKHPFLYYTSGNITRNIINIYYRNSQTFLSIVFLNKTMVHILFDFLSNNPVQFLPITQCC